MKLLICTGIYPPEIGGPATYSKLIAEKLAERGHQVRILTYGDKKITNQELRITNISKKLPVGIRYFFYFLKVLKLGKTMDIIYVQDSVSAGFPTALANIFLKKKLFLKVVGDYAWEQGMQMQSDEFKMQNLDNFYPFKNEDYPLKIQILEKIQNWVARCANKIITPSFYLKGILINGWKIKEDKVRVIYNSFNVPAPSIARSEITQQSQNLKIISVGRLVPWKGFDILIEVIRDIPNVELEIIGDGPEYNNCKLLITNYKLENRVRLSGRLSHGEVIKKMQQANLFVLNTAYEGLSHVILEAMACGLPVAVSRAGGNTELVGKNEERGFLFEYNNKEQIKSIIICMDISTDKAKKAREYVSSLNEDNMIKQLEDNLQG